MILIDNELINEELETARKEGFEFKQINLSNRLLKKLFNRYYVEIRSTKMYDSIPPDFDQRTLQAAFFYNYPTGYSETERVLAEDSFAMEFGERYTPEEGKQAAENRKRIFEQHRDSRERLITCTDIINTKVGDDISQENLDTEVYDMLCFFKTFPYSKKGRVYFSKMKDSVLLYVYTRDTEGVDDWIILKKRKKRKTWRKLRSYDF